MAKPPQIPRPGSIRDPLLGDVERTTLDAEMERAYGDEWGTKLRDALVSQPPGPLLDYRGTVDEHLQKPLTVITSDSTKIPHYTKRDHTIRNSEAAARAMGLSPEAVRQHEVGHAIAPPRKSGFELRGDTLWHTDMDRSLQPAESMRVLFDEHPELRNHPAVAELGMNYGRHLSYASTLPEIVAEANRLRRLEYGVHGKLPLDDASRMDMLEGWLKADPTQQRVPDDVLPSSLSPWPDRELQQFGPNAGKPAEGYNTLREQMRILLPRMPARKRDLFIEWFNRGADARGPSEVQYA